MGLLYLLQFQSLSFIEMGTGKFEETERFTGSLDQKLDWDIPNWYCDIIPRNLNVTLLNLHVTPCAFREI